jgi:signal transduction histidine kinase
MVDSTFEPIRQPRRLWLRMLYLIAASYLLGSVLLGLFVASGALAGWVPLAYAAAGLAWCVVFYALMASGFSDRFADSNLTLAKLVSAALLQIAFIVLAPAAALYFVCALFIVFAFASLRLPPRQVLLAWIGVALALALVLTRMPAAFNLIHETVFQRALVGVAIVLMLARCTLLGLYNSFLRAQLMRRHEKDRASLEQTAQRGRAMAAALHEDLGQELAGLALLLAASANRLERDGHPGAPEVSNAVAHLRAAVAKTRLLADEARAAPRVGGLARRRG